MKKTLLCLLVVATLLSCLTPVSVLAADGGAAQPISSAAEFEAMDPQGSYYLTKDLDFGGKVYDKGYILNDFSGTLDGRGYSIYNYTVTGTAHAGTFSTLGSFKDTTIKNLQIGKPDLPVKVSATAPSGSALPYLGALASRQYDAQAFLTLDNVVVYGEVTTFQGVANLNVGGIVGVTSNCKITNCRMYGKVEAYSLTKHQNVAGIVSYMMGNGGVIENCYNFAKVIVHTNHTVRAAGIVAYINATTGAAKIRGCVNYGEIYLDGEIYEGYRTTRYGLCSGIVSDIQRANNVIESCINFGTVNNDAPTNTAIVSGSSGILAWNYKANTVKNCVNYGKLVVVQEDLLKDAVCMKNETIDATMENNLDLTGKLGENISDKVKSAGVQSSDAKNGLVNVRFLSTVDAVSYDSVGFEITALYYRDGELHHFDLPLETYSVYEKICAKKADGTNAEITASELGGSYIVAAAIKNIPTSGSVTFVCRPYAKKGEATLYGDAQAYVYCDGAFLLAENVA